MNFPNRQVSPSSNEPVVEPEFSVNDGFVTTIRRAGQVTGEVAGEVTGEVAGEVGSRPESRPESLELRVLGLLGNGPLSKAELSAGLGHKEISGQLNKIIRLLLAEQNIEYTIPGKPNSRLQKYRLSDKGMATLKVLRKGTSAS
jgi:ATP-dependent DNA helicase RecG